VTNRPAERRSVKLVSGTPTNRDLQMWLDADNQKLYWMDRSTYEDRTKWSECRIVV